MAKQINKNYSVNAAYAISKAQDAVENWKQAVEKAKKIGTSEEIAFCVASLTACEESLAKVKADVRDNWTGYL